MKATKCTKTFVSNCISYLNITALSAILFNLLGWQNQLQVGTRRRNHGSSVFEIFWQRQRVIDVDKPDVVFGLNFKLWTTMSELEALWKKEKKLTFLRWYVMKKSRKMLNYEYEF